MKCWLRVQNGLGPISAKKDCLQGEMLRMAYISVSVLYVVSQADDNILVTIDAPF